MRKDLEGNGKNLYLCIRFRPKKSINDERLTINERVRGKGKMEEWKEALVL